MPTYRLGMNSKLYYSATLVTGITESDIEAPTYIELTNVKDVTINLETGEADVTTRANNGWRATESTLKDGSIEFEMNWDDSDAGFDAIQAAWLNGTKLAIKALNTDEATVGAKGLAGNFSVTNFSVGQPLEEAVSVSVTLKPNSFNTWYENVS